MPTNDNDHPPGGGTPAPVEAHGHAALLLVESLIHGLRETVVLSREQAVDIVERAIEVQADEDEEDAAADVQVGRSRALLMSIAASLRLDSSDPPAPPRVIG